MPDDPDFLRYQMDRIADNEDPRPGVRRKGPNMYGSWFEITSKSSRFPGATTKTSNIVTNKTDLRDDIAKELKSLFGDGADDGFVPEEGASLTVRYMGEVDSSS